MKLQAGQISAPHHGGQIIDENVTDFLAAYPARHGRRLNPIGRETGRIFLVESLPADSIRKALEGDRAIFEMWKKPFRHPRVVVDHVRLGESSRRVENLI